MVGFLALLLLAAPQKWPIDSLSVEGLKNYSQAQVLAVAGLKTGQLAGKADFEAARERLIKAGVFETVGYHFAPTAESKGYAAAFHVIEVEPVFPVRFEGLNAPDAEVRGWLTKKDPFFGGKMPATEALLKSDAASIQEYLAAKGHPDTIEAKVVADAPDQFVIVFRPAAGAAKVAEVRFQGNTVIPSSVLLNTFGGIAYGTVYSEQAFRQMLDAGVRPLYDARGRVRVAFTKIETEKAKNVDGVVVTVTVDEGASYDLGEVHLEGASPVPAKELIKSGGFKSGDMANFDDVNAGLDRMKKRLHREGYTRASFSVERHINDQKKIVDLTIGPDLGPQFLFGALTIEGLDLNGEAQIKKMWVLEPGKPFNADYPDYFLDQVREQGLFDDLGKTKSANKVDEETRTVDVTLTFGASTEPGAKPRATSRRRER
jgi:outer membrane protein insertion porin family